VFPGEWNFCVERGLASRPKLPNQLQGLGKARGGPGAPGARGAAGRKSSPSFSLELRPGLPGRGPCRQGLSARPRPLLLHCLMNCSPLNSGYPRLAPVRAREGCRAFGSRARCRLDSTRGLLPSLRGQGIVASRQSRPGNTLRRPRRRRGPRAGKIAAPRSVRHGPNEGPCRAQAGGRAVPRCHALTEKPSSNIDRNAGVRVAVQNQLRRERVDTSLSKIARPGCPGPSILCRPGADRVDGRRPGLLGRSNRCGRVCQLRNIPVYILLESGSWGVNWSELGRGTGR